MKYQNYCFVCHNISIKKRDFMEVYEDENPDDRSRN